ncbi:MAG: S-layer homology domain-containing protein [Clostridia bacterium]|nr:S-layer homology domain-containing protein [Clostridia bacterium]
MKKKQFLMYILMIVTFIQISFFADTCTANTNQQKIIDGTDVVEIKVICDIAGQGHPKPPEKSYAWRTNEEKVIQDIIHRINAFDLNEDGKTVSGGDLSVVNINIKLADETFYNVGFVDGRFYNEKGKQFYVERTEYKRFLDHIYALKTYELTLPDQEPFETSEWAKTYIAQAKLSNLVPRWNQIWYKSDIIRLETCQLIDNLLKINGCETELITNSVFSDINDISVNQLYKIGIIDGKESTKFYPFDRITREELAKVLSKTYHFLNQDAEIFKSEKVYADNEEISEWARPYIAEMTKLGVLQGEDNGYFNPKEEITKEQVIVALLNINNLFN